MKADVNKFLKRGLSLLFVFILLMGGYACLMFHYSETKGLTLWVHELYEIKDLAADRESPKIIILAGSSAYFGLSAKRIEAELGIPTVNYASHMGLGDYMFERVKRITKPGDIILFPIEYELYWNERKKPFTQQSMRERYVLTYDKKYYQSLNFFERINLNLVNVEDLMLNIKYQDEDFHASVYDASETNMWGDSTGNRLGTKEGFQPGMIIFPGDFKTDINSYYGAKKIKEFIQWTKDNDVTLIASFPGTVYFHEYDNYGEEFEAIKRFYREEGIIVIGEPQEFLYDISYFHDNKYHLTNKGMEMKTEATIRYLKIALGEECNPMVNRSWWCLD